MDKPQSFDELVKLYGKPWESPAAYTEFEKKFMRVWKAEVWEAKTCAVFPLSTRHIYCNADLIPVLDGAFAALASRGLLPELKTFDGCWNVRKVRGSEEKYSIHSFGLAIDLNAKENPLGGPVQFSPGFLACMKGSGLTCGAFFPRVDGMHFQFADHC